MKNLKVTINSEDRIVLIPMEYDIETDTLHIKEIQIDPYPDENDNVSSDPVMQLTALIINTLNNL